MRATKLQELEDMAAKLLATARKLPPGPDRNDILQEIGRFWSKIIALQEAAPRPARRGLNRRRGNEMRKLIALLAAPRSSTFGTKVITTANYSMGSTV
jgi:hypothetical protein